MKGSKWNEDRKDEEEGRMDNKNLKKEAAQVFECLRGCGTEFEIVHLFDGVGSKKKGRREEREGREGQEEGMKAMEMSVAVLSGWWRQGRTDGRKNGMTGMKEGRKKARQADRQAGRKAERNEQNERGIRERSQRKGPGKKGIRKEEGNQGGK
jgi:hypothetical protein